MAAGSYVDEGNMTVSDTLEKLADMLDKISNGKK